MTLNKDEVEFLLYEITYESDGDTEMLKKRFKNLEKAVKEYKKLSSKNKNPLIEYRLEVFCGKFDPAVMRFL